MKIDWYKHYTLEKKILLNKNTFLQNLEVDKPFINCLKKYLNPKGKILECGCGPARTVMSISHNGFDVTAIDIDKKMLKMAKKYSKITKKKVKFIHMDFFNIDKKFKKDSFDCITHEGVLEHYSKAKIRRILKKQLGIAPIIVFSIPTKTKFNTNYFSDNIPRNLWKKSVWIKEILSIFSIKEAKVVRQRSDNLIVVVSRK